MIVDEYSQPENVPCFYYTTKAQAGIIEEHLQSKQKYLKRYMNIQGSVLKILHRLFNYFKQR